MPVSWMAVASLAVAALFAMLLLGFGYVAFANKKPLLMQELLVLPVIAVVVSFAARRMIRNSEGTRTGENLADIAWWGSVVLGLGYIAYLFAIDFSIRNEASDEVNRWVKQIQDNEFEKAFYRTLPPGARQGLNASDTYDLEKRFRDDLLAFRKSDLMKIAQRNKGECVFVPGSVVDWSYKPGTIDCVLSGTFKCAEGVFPLQIPLKGIDGVTETGVNAGRQWMIVRPPTGGFIQQEKAERTEYGWLVAFMEIDGTNFAKGYIEHSMAGPQSHPMLYHAFVAPNGDLMGWTDVIRKAISFRDFRAFALFAGFGIHLGAEGKASDAADFYSKKFFKLLGGSEPSDIQKAKFATSWNTLGLLDAGTRLRDGNGGVADRESVLRITETAVEVHVPVELPQLTTAGKLETARGRLVVVCENPKVLEELRNRRQAAATEKPTNTPSDDILRGTPIRWRIDRLESDLTPVNIAQKGEGQGGLPPPQSPPPMPK